MERFSFIPQGTQLKKISSRSQLDALMKECEKEDIPTLRNLDLSDLDNCDNLNFDGYHLQNIVFSRFRPDKKEKKLLFGLSFLGAHLTGVVFAQAHMQQCNFDTKDQGAYDHHQNQLHGKEVKKEAKLHTTELKGVDFFFSDLDFCRFRRTKAERVDFRYAHLTDCTLGKFEVSLGDFYCCGFYGVTNFIDSKFVNCSFTCVTFEYACIRMVNLPDGIAQEYSDVYHHQFLNSTDWQRYNPCHSFSSMNEDGYENGETEEKTDEDQEEKEKKLLRSNLSIAGEAMNVYRNLSGIYAGKGLNRDSNEAYRKAKLMERKFYKLKRKAIKVNAIYYDKKHDGSKCGMWWTVQKTYLTQALGFGYIWWVPVIWFFVLVILFAIIYYLANNNLFIPLPDSLSDFFESIAYSLNNALSPFDGFYHVVNILAASLQSTLGVLLVGFLGFVIANKIRSDS